MATKKQQFAFYEDALEFILSIGAKNKHTGELATEYFINTIAGKLNITLHTPEKSQVFSIYCLFDDTQKAVNVFGSDERLNKYSGKWNFHGYNAAYTLYEFQKELSKILLLEPAN